MADSRGGGRGINQVRLKERAGQWTERRQWAYCRADSSLLGRGQSLKKSACGWQAIVDPAGEGVSRKRAG